MKDDKKTKEQLLQELTELRSQDAALKESDSADSANKYRSLVENLRDVIYELDSQGVVLYISSAIRDMLGYDPTEIEGKSFIEFAHKDDRSSLTEWYSELSKGIEKPYEYRISNKSGEPRWAQTKTKPVMEDGLFRGARGIIIDVTAQRRAEEALRESEEKYREIFESITDVFYRTDNEGTLLIVSPSVERLSGYVPDEVVGKKLGDFYINPEERNQFLSVLREKGEVKGFEAALRTKDGSVVFVSTNAQYYRDKQRNIIGIQGNTRDITERKRAEGKLRESEEKYRWMLNNMTDVITVMDMNLRFTYVSPSIMHMRGYTAEEATAQTFEQVMTPESLQITAKVFDEEMKLEASGTADPDRTRILEVEQYRKDGSIVLMENRLSFMRDEAKKAVGIISVSRDITERKRAEEELKESKALIESVVENIPLMIFLKEATDLRFVIFNRAGEELLGYNRRDLIGKSDLDLFPLEQAAHFIAKDREVLDGEAGMLDIPEEPILTAQKGQRLLHTRKICIRGSDGATKFLLGISEDITDRKQAEEALTTSEAHYRMLAEHMTDIVWMMDLDLNVTWLSPSAMKARGFSVDEIISLPLDRQLTPESLGKALNWLGKLMHLERDGLISEPDGILSRELEFYCKDDSTIVLDCTFQFIRDDQGRARGILAEGRDITTRKKVEKELQQTLDSLRKAVGTTIQAMVSAVEVRDPYTAGHQLRSADLARCIATEMGLAKEKIEGIRMAGAIHDIGKLSIPAEILSKPTRLSEIEFSLIKEHAQKGYEMLKDVESPWPLAEIVHQHHERMDGSGYPKNLKGEEILMEARILAVADVVEAMASHRPYRPGLGIDAALEEIEKNRGTFYDEAVVDACLRLFREKGFELERT